MKDEILKVICETLDVRKEELRPNKSLYESIGVDSTEMVELVVSLKKAFAIEVESNEITKNSTCEDIVALIESKKN
ncbi:MAG: acyl carrier protein [Candidatus Omnitrophica bacterium]|jgi:acyl carrier protein|nr:acyl carrier protein [Candidatus Omnitrophota bacterium]MDD5080890.1 acyl carrier protein [Candidatus Omnitrophota bacterium]